MKTVLRSAVLPLLLLLSLIVPMQVSAAGNVFVQLDMVTAKVGWASTPTSVLRTTNGGKTWKAVFHVPKPKPAMASGPYFVFASDGTRRAWAVATSSHGIWTYRTTDGGSGWTPYFGQFTGSTRTPIAGLLVFANAAHGWLLLHDGAGMGSAPHAIIRTANGGRSWSRVEWQYLGGANSESPKSLPACDGAVGTISFDTLGHGWVTGFCGAAPNWKLIYHSADGGKAWSKASVKGPYSKVQYFDPGQVTVAGRSTELSMVSVSSPGECVLYRSTDDGASWKPTTPIRHKGSSYAGPTCVYAPLSYRTSWVVVGSKLFRTTDGGAKWRIVAASVPVLPAQLQFVSASTGFLRGPNGQLYGSRDSGAHWRLLTSRI